MHAHASEDRGTIHTGTATTHRNLSNVHAKYP